MGIDWQNARSGFAVVPQPDRADNLPLAVYWVSVTPEGFQRPMVAVTRGHESDRFPDRPIMAGVVAVTLRAARELCELDYRERCEPYTSADERPNGSCDECGDEIVDNPWGGRRVCSYDRGHDCYGDNYNNGGDPIAQED